MTSLEIDKLLAETDALREKRLPQNSACLEPNDVERVILRPGEFPDLADHAKNCPDCRSVVLAAGGNHEAL